MHKSILYISDFLIIIGTFFCSLLIRFGGIVNVVEHQWPTLIFLLLLLPIAFHLNDLYNRFFYTQRLRLFFRIVKAWLLVLSLYVIIGFLTKFAFLIESRVFIILFHSLFIFIFFLFRLMFVKKVLEYYFLSSKRKISCKYIGPQESFEFIHNFFKDNRVTGLQIIDSNGSGVVAHKYDEVFIYSVSEKYEDLYNEIKANVSSGKTLHIASQLFTKLNLGWEWCFINGMPVYTFPKRRRQVFGNYLRRIIDVVGSVIGLILLAPFFLVVSVAIKLDSRGSVIYRQQRCGKDGKRFTFYKFRSMRVHDKAETDLLAESNHYMNNTVPKLETIEFEYITDIGKILRKTSIDEWPQFVNVLKGEMSLIGPRPHRPHEVECYQEWHKDRLMVKQGLTGLWQIYGRGEMPCDKSIFLDLVYVINRSVPLDIKLIFQTIPAVVLGKGAY